MNDRTLRFTEEWLRLLADAARGTRAAQSAIRSLGTLTPEKLAQGIARWLPAGVAPPAAESLAQWTEELWSRIGVVPRYRYQQLLERYEALRARLEEAEVTIRRLKRLLSKKGREGDAEKLLDLWANVVGDTLRSQAEWMRTWIGEPGELGAHDQRIKPAGPRKRKEGRPG